MGQLHSTCTAPHLAAAEAPAAMAALHDPVNDGFTVHVAQPTHQVHPREPPALGLAPLFTHSLKTLEMTPGIVHM
jgi:hypothetical protein